MLKCRLTGVSTELTEHDFVTWSFLRIRLPYSAIPHSSAAAATKHSTWVSLLFIWPPFVSTRGTELLLLTLRNEFNSLSVTRSNLMTAMRHAWNWKPAWLGPANRIRYFYDNSGSEIWIWIIIANLLTDISAIECARLRAWCSRQIIAGTYGRTN